MKMASKEISISDSRKAGTRPVSDKFRQMPLVSLLPQLSTVSELKQYRDIVEQRLAFLQNDDNLSIEQNKLSEISMLQQALGWLEIQTDA